MIEYNATGLPKGDVNLFKAYMSYAKNAKSLPEEAGLSEDFGIKVAQVLNTTTGGNPELLTLALLSTTPQSVWGVLEKSFGPEVVGQMEESLKHTRTGYAYIDQASTPVKLLSMATAIAVFEEMQEKSGKMDEALSGLQSGMTDPAALESMLPGMMQGLMPDTGLYSQLARTLADKTGNPQLEQLFAEKLEEFKQSQQDQRDRLAEMGIMIMMPGMDPMSGGAAPEFRYPSFDETGMLDDPKVRAAYEVVTSHPGTRPDDFEGALEAGKLLSSMASKNPTVVAAALLDVGIRGLNNDDFGFLDKKIDWDVLDLIRVNSVRAINPMTLAEQPQEFQQIVVANLTAQLGHVRESMDGLQERMDQPPAGLPPELAGMALPPEIKQQMMMQAVMQVERISTQAQRIARPLFAKLDAPELETAFNEKVQTLTEFVAENAPKTGPLHKPGQMGGGLPDVFRRKPPSTGNDFSFD